jgi:hypothetical protein
MKNIKKTNVSELLRTIQLLACHTVENQIKTTHFETSFLAAAILGGWDKKDTAEWQSIVRPLEQINQALRNASTQEQHLDLTADLMKVWWERWCEGGVTEDVFGPAVKIRGNRQSIMTLSPKGSQLRIWYGFPGAIEFRDDHIDSCGLNLLATISGEPGLIRQYKEELLQFVGFQTFEHASGACVFMMQMRW